MENSNQLKKIVVFVSLSLLTLILLFQVVHSFENQNVRISSSKVISLSKSNQEVERATFSGAKIENYSPTDKLSSDQLDSIQLLVANYLRKQYKETINSMSVDYNSVQNSQINNGDAIIYTTTVKVNYGENKYVVVTISNVNGFNSSSEITEDSGIKTSYPN